MSTPVVPVVVLVSGSGTLLQALIDAADDPAYGARVAGVVADRECEGIERARRAGIQAHVVRLADHPDRSAWDDAVATVLDGIEHELVVLAGFMRLLGERPLAGRLVINTHPALLPSFPGAHGVRDALAYGVKVTGSTCIVVDSGVDSGPVVEQVVVPVLDGDDEQRLHERIKVAEREMLVDVVRRIARHGLRVEGRSVHLAP